MRYAVISDIHGNLEALQAVLRRIDEERVDEVVCLGDIVGYGPDPNECCSLVRSSCSRVFLGNHDEWVFRTPNYARVPEAVWQSIMWTERTVVEENKAFLSGLPLIGHAEGRMFVHASPVNPDAWEYIMDDQSAARCFPVIGNSLCYLGHTHIPGEFRLGVRDGADGEIRDDGVGVIVNVGSVGQPRDGNPLASFVISESHNGRTLRRVVRVPYDTTAVAAKIIASGLPDFFATRLAKGR